MDFKNKKLPLKWMYLPWISFVFTMLVFTVLGSIAKGDPNKFLARMGLDSALVAFSLTILGALLAVLILRHLLLKNGFSWANIGLKGKLNLKSVLFAFLGWLVAFFLFYIIQVIFDSLGIGMFWEGDPDFIQPNSVINILLILVGPVLIPPEGLIPRGLPRNFLKVFFNSYLVGLAPRFLICFYSRRDNL